jgi:hypothetical protein
VGGVKRELVNSSSPSLFIKIINIKHKIFLTEVYLKNILNTVK